VKLVGYLKVWEEAKTLIQQLYLKAQDQKSFSMVVEALLLRAKCTTIEGELHQTQKYYNPARITAAEKNLGLLGHKVDAEQKSFEAEFDKMQDLIRRNTSIQERLEHVRMEEYIKRSSENGKANEINQ